MTTKRTKKVPAPKPTEGPAKDAAATAEGAPKEAAPVETATPKSLSDRIEAMRGMDLPALRQEYLRVFGHPTAAKDRDALFTRITERLALGGSAPKKAGRPIKGAPAKTAATPDAAKPAKQTPTKASPFTSDPRLPKPGSTIERVYKGETLKVEVREDGFLYERETYRSLSALARKITGAASINGLLFFHLTTPKATKPAGDAKPAAKRAPKAKAARKTSRKGKAK